MYEKTIKTKFGTAKIDKNGYYNISSKNEGNHKKLLHRLTYEDYYHVCLLPSVIIHHIDGNKKNNNINNLTPVYLNEHTKFHHRGVPNIKQSTRNGLPYRVNKEYSDRYSQGYFYKYRYTYNGKVKKLSSVNINKLHDKVINSDLPWKWLDYNPNNINLWYEVE